MRALIDGTIPKPSTKRPVDPRLEEIVMKALSPDPEGRYGTAQGLRTAIDQYLADTSPKTSMREVGELVSTVFAEQHEARKRHIHVALTAPRSEPPPPIPEGIEAIVQSGTGITVQSLVQERKRQLVWTVAIAIGAAVMALGGMIAFMTWRGSNGDTAAVNTAATAPLPAQIQIRLTATPTSAALAVDGNPLSGNPALLTVPSDTRDHEIRATLAGHEPYVRNVKFERDLSLEIMLQPLPAPTASVAPEVSAKPTIRGHSGPRPVRPVVIPPKKPASNCDPPFYFENGIKVYKPGCL